jgi:hypothetical protein
VLQFYEEQKEMQTEGHDSEQDDMTQRRIVVPHAKDKILEEQGFQTVDVGKFSLDAMQRCNRERYRHDFLMFETLMSCLDSRHRS